MSGYSLIINAGSATYKYAFFQGRKKTLRFLYQKEGEKIYTVQKNSAPKESISKTQFENSLKDVIKREKAICSNIEIIGFRIVHGGDKYHKPTIVTKQVISNVKKLNELAPLHNPFATEIIKKSQKIFPGKKKILIFDTAFHHDMPDENKKYALPKNLVKKMGIRKYGFHGIIGASLVHQLGWRLQRKTILCHLGSGSSVTAIRNGKSIDTSMGYTPLEGLMMGTRAGDLDPGLVVALQKKLGTKTLEKVLNNESGLKALAGSGDMREVLMRAGKKNSYAILAMNMFCKKAAKHIAGAVISLGGVEHIVFSGGIGENAPLIREKICENLKPLGVKISHKRNKHSKAGEYFQKRFSRIKLSYLHADEESEMNRILQEYRKN